MADATGRPVALPLGEEPVLLGSAMLASVACGADASLQNAMARMSGSARLFTPATGDLAHLHANRHACFTALQAVARQFQTPLTHP